MAESEADVVSFMHRTLCAVQCQALNVNVADIARTSLQRLVDDGLVTRKRQTDDVCRLDVTNLGKAVYKGKCHEYCIIHEAARWLDILQLISLPFSVMVSCKYPVLSTSPFQLCYFT